MSDSLRTFTTVKVFDFVKVKLPENGFQTKHFIQAGQITKDNKVVLDKPHYFSGVPLDNNVYLNRHFYFRKPLLKPGIKSVVARVEILTEEINGREFTRLDIFPHMNGQMPQYELKINQNPTVSNNGYRVKNTKAKIVFEEIKSGPFDS